MGFVAAFASTRVERNLRPTAPSSRGAADVAGERTGVDFDGGLA
jgi:hypothetical protein